MKNKIREILREETSGFDENMFNVLRQFMNHFTKGYVCYHDTPENRFEYTPGSIWLINPETEDWVFELDKDGTLWWYWKFYRNFKRYFNMEESDYEEFINLWVEDVLNLWVSSTDYNTGASMQELADVLKNGKELK